MLNVLTCLATEHDLRLVIVAGLVCFFGCFTSFRLYSRMREAVGLGVQGAWMLLTGLVAGCSVWATHFIAMLAYETGLRSGFLPTGTLASLLIAVVFMGAAFAAAALASGRGGRLVGGVLAGAGVAAMHYTGMAAYVTEGRLSWDLPTVAASLAVSFGVSVLAMFAAGLAQTRSRQFGADVQRLAGLSLVGDVLAFDGPEPVEGRGEGRLRPLDGGPEIPIEAFARVLEAGAAGGDLRVLAVRDLRERRSAEEKIRYLAEHDGLTGLSNRNVMQKRLDQALEQAAASGQGLAVICIDLDHFKEANDLHGHLAGDAVLAQTAERLRRAVKAPSFAARLGGDEFVIVQAGPGDQPAAAAELCSELLEALSEPVPFADQALRVGASMGVSLYPHDGDDGDVLLANADMALYRAKENGRGGYTFFKREMDETIRERRGLARELREAIAAGELILHYQPLARAADGKVCGFEALVRWRHPGRGMIAPMEFIPVAEESGLILPLGEWVLRRACAEAAAWDAPLRIAVNLSPVQLHQTDLPTLVHEVLLETGLAPSRLELEVTETALFKDYQRALDNLRRLKALGVRIAMDDFGTGYSSLSTLQSFPFDKIKIDKSFVENIHRHERATAIVRAVLSLGRSLDIPVTAEGVETLEQLEFLRSEACAEVQGYAIGRPAPLAAEEVEERALAAS